MYNGIKIAVVIYSVHVYNMILVSGHYYVVVCYVFLVVFLLSVHVFVCMCVYMFVQASTLTS